MKTSLIISFVLLSSTVSAQMLFQQILQQILIEKPELIHTDLIEEDIEFDSQDFDEDEIIDVVPIEEGEDSVIPIIVGEEEEEEVKELPYHHAYSNCKTSQINDSSLLNRQSAQLGYKLVGFELLPCSGSEIRNLKKRISALTYEEDTLSLNVAFSDNCCIVALGEIEIKGDTLNLIYHNCSNGYCMCHCCFEFNYKIHVKSNSIKHYQLNGFNIIETDQVYIQSRTEKTFYPNGKIKSRIYYLDEFKRTETFYDENGKRTETIHYKFNY